MRFIGFYDYTVILTYMSLLSAVSGILLSGQGRFTAAMLCLLLCGICDGFDGTVARSKKNRTEDERAFGIQIDSLCDVVSFGLFPALWCYFYGMDGVLGVVIVAVYALCAVIRLAFFNVLEGKRQQTEGGCNKAYRGLPVTSISILLPAAYAVKLILPQSVFLGLLHGLMATAAFLFVLDFRVKKLQLGTLFGGKI